jgi:eukaryotic-like serine/threonine-protein kinase
MSPDGRRLAFIGTKDGRQQIWIQALDSVTATPLAGTDGAVSPFWSPDSRFVGFFSTADGQLKKIEPSGGAVLTICAAQMDGAPVWGRDGTILFTEFPGGGIHRVAATGGTPVPVTTIDKTRRELNHYWPEFLPDGRHFLYLATGLDATGLRATPGVYVASFGPGEAPRLLARTHSKMIAAVSGYLLFVQDGAILAQRFDADTRQLSGEPIRVADGVGYFRTLGNGAFTLSATGELAYLGNATPIGFTWYDRKGAASNTGWEPQNVGSIRMSPDGHRIVADISDPAVGTADIWIYDADRGAPVRLTTDLMNETQPIWSPGAQRVLFRWERGGSPNLYAKTVGSGAEEQLVVDPSPLTPEDWSPDGKWIAYVRNTRQTALDLWLMPLEGERTPRPFSTERFDEWGAKFSPDSRWVAFASTESGSPEVYVAPRGAPGDRQRISVGGGSTPRWRADGRELFYVTPDNRAFMAVPVQATTTFTAGTPARLFSLSLPAAARDRARNVVYDVTPDGQRFLIGAQAGEASTSRITVVMNWTSAVLR